MGISLPGRLACCLILGTAMLSRYGPPLLGGENKGAQVDVLVVDESWTVAKELTVRARVTAITPAEPTSIRWRHGGEGLGGRVTRGTLPEKLDVGQWSQAVPVASLVRGGFPSKLFLTFMVGRGGRLKPRTRGGGFETEGGSKDVEVEFEFSYKGKALKRFKEAGYDGGTVGIVIPAYRLTGGKTPESAEFLDELSGLLEYVRRRAEKLEGLPWAKKRLPELFAIVTDLGGYGTGIYYGIRTTNKAVVETDCRSLRQLGVNGFRNAPRFLAEMVYERRGFAKAFTRIRDLPAMGYPVPRFRKGRQEDPEAGCPFAPGVAERTTQGVNRALKLLNLRVHEVWGLTVDEIGTVVDMSRQGKGHLAVCPYCAEGFREYLKRLGLKPADFGRRDWSQIRPLNIWQRPKPDREPETQPAKPPWQTEKGAALQAYYTAKFNNCASARLFSPLREAFDAANNKKQQARIGGRDDPARGQPWVFSYALRGNTFLMRGHSLDFFEFYRHADNAFVYETSNRDARIWSWDSYLCDVGRIVSSDQGLRFGIYVKPHRGAPIQRALTAVSRGATMIYWYTYGPDYAKGDSFSQHWDVLVKVSQAARLIGAAEDVLFRSSWVRPAEVAVVKPRSSEIWMRLAEEGTAWQAAWENAKWTYTALQHAHIPVDPLDEVMLATADLSRYKVIYISGPSLTRAAARRIAQWVESGGTLCTSGWGLVRDEANQPLDVLQPVLGLKKRNEPQMWYRVALYGATRLEPYDDARRVIAPVPDGAKIVGSAPFTGSFQPVIGREVLEPDVGTEVLVRFADGGAAVTRHAYGKGQAYVVGFFPGLEYSAGVRRHTRAPVFDMSKDFDPGRRSYVAAPALGRVQPVVDAAQPTVEGVLLKDRPTGDRAVTLMNWAYRVVAHRQRGRRVSPVCDIVPFENLRVHIRGAGPVKRVRSATLDQVLPLRRDKDGITVTLPRLDEADVLLLE